MDRERMLKRFTRLERVTVEARQSGSGLGLAIASRAVERLGGTQIEFEDGNPGLSVSVEFALFRPD